MFFVSVLAPKITFKEEDTVSSLSEDSMIHLRGLLSAQDLKRLQVYSSSNFSDHHLVIYIFLAHGQRVLDLLTINFDSFNSFFPLHFLF